jgi:membrane fusion protein (multidrug efflux system)
MENNNDKISAINNEIKNIGKKKRGLKVYIPLTLVIIIVICAAIYWYIEYSKYIRTDDAHVDSDEVSVSSKIMGRIVHLYVNEGDSVKKGMLLVELDSTDLIAQKQQTITMRQQTIASKILAEAKYRSDRENIKVLKVNYEKTIQDFDRAQDQYSQDVISKEQYQHIQKAYESSKAQLDAANIQLDVSKAQIGSTIASIENSESQIGIIETQLQNTKIYAPMDGVIAKRWLLTGDIVQIGQSILSISNNQNFWVAAFLEETKMENVHINQKVLFSLDAYPGITFFGKIFFIGSNTASQFSLIPPNNASGNFTKVTQRIPLKISIEGTEEGKNPSLYNFIAGMSSVIKIVK